MRLPFFFGCHLFATFGCVVVRQLDLTTIRPEQTRHPPNFEPLLSERHTFLIEDLNIVQKEDKEISYTINNLSQKILKSTMKNINNIINNEIK